MVASQRTEALLAHPSPIRRGWAFCMRRWAHRTHLAGRLVALGGAPCPGAAGQQPAGPLPLPDAGGRRVRLAGPAHRLVSLAPSITELLFAMGAGDQVVGRTVYDKYPPAALQVPAVGDG